MLLQRDDVNPDKPDNEGRTLLWNAAYNGHVGVVKMLLERDDVNPDRPGNGGQTPLNFAARHGHVEVVKILLGSDDVDPDKLDEYGRTPFPPTARHGLTGAAVLLQPRRGDEDAARTGRAQPRQARQWRLNTTQFFSWVRARRSSDNTSRKGRH